MSLEDLKNKIKEGETQTINVIVKADVQGSAEAVKQALEKLKLKVSKLRLLDLKQVRLLNLILS